MPLSLYVHLPWCVSKCPYCDFNSHASPLRDFPEREYLAALLGDLEYEARRHEGRELVSVFFGGGTPSLFGGESIARLVRAAGEGFAVRPGLEVTLEANPGTIERGRFDDYRAAGVTRISLGAQSFDDRRLRALGRIHAAADTLASVTELRSSGFTNFNLDLMYALPGQTLEQALDDLDQAVALEPTHLSHYQLTLEPGTGFAKRPPVLPDEDASFEMQLACQSRLDAAGFEQYEVSAYARAGQRCVHNLNYWLHGDYVGIGAGAHGKRSEGQGGRVWRTERLRHPGRYLEAADAEGRITVEREVPAADRAFEYFLNALRLRDAFAEREFESRAGLPFASVRSRVEAAEARGLLAREDGDCWRTTELGRRFLNDLQAMFLP